MMDKKAVGGDVGTPGEVGGRLPESLARRNEARLEKVAKRREEEDGPRHREAFLETFKDKEAEIIRALATAPSLEDDRSKLGELFKQVSQSIQTLNKFVFASSSYLRAFDLRTCKESLQALEDAAKDEEERLLPKKKFGFRNKVIGTGGGTGVKRAERRERKISEDEPDTTESVSREGEVRNKKGEEVVVMGDGRDVVVTGLEGCRVVVEGKANTVVLAGIRACLVAAGPVATSVMIQGCTGSRLAFACQQVRIHDTIDTDFYLHITTKPIIEDSKRVRFAPYPYPGLEDDMRAVGLNPEVDCWDSVNDFNWLASKPSPNWSLVPPEQRKTDWPQLH